MAGPGAVLVYGATGFTGRLIVEALHRRSISFSIAGRPSAALTALAHELGVACFEAEMTDAPALARAFASATVVIACAGPFVKTGAALIDAALAAGTPLLDLSGEATHLRASFTRDAEVKARGLRVVHSVGFDVVPAELLASLCASPLGPLNRLELATGHTYGVASHGTLQSYQSMSSEARGLAWVDSALVEEPIGAHRRLVSFSQPLGDRAVASAPTAEVVLVPRSVQTQHFRHCLGSLAPAALPVAEQGLPMFSNEKLEASLRRLKSAGLLGPDQAAREKNQFFLWCRAESVDGRSREMTMQGADPYGLSATLAVEAARMVHSGQVKGHGVLTPLQAFDRQALLALLAQHGVRWHSVAQPTSTHS